MLQKSIFVRKDLSTGKNKQKANLVTQLFLETIKLQLHRSFCKKTREGDYNICIPPDHFMQ